VPVFSPALRSFRWSAWLSARLRRFYRWRHGGEFARLLIFDQILAFDSIAAAAARVRGHKLGDWRIQEGCAAATCIRCGRQLVVYYSPLQPDMDGSALRNGCLKGSRQSTVLAPPEQGRHEGLALPEHANGTLSVAVVPTSAGTISPSGLYTAPAVSPSPANVIVTMATVTIGSAPAFYVSTTGNDNNDGYSGSPWRTIQHLEQYIRGGAEFEEVAI